MKGLIILFMGLSISTTSFGGSFNIRCNSHLKIKPKLSKSDLRKIHPVANKVHNIFKGNGKRVEVKKISFPFKKSSLDS